MKKWITLVTSGLGLFTNYGWAEPPQPGTGVLVKIAVSGARNNQGQVGCALFKSPDAFPSEDLKAFRLVNVAIHDGHAQCEFQNIPPGVYAVAVMHDENGNNKLDTGLFGIPKEGFGFSSGAHAHMFSPAKFDEAKFSVTNTPVNQEIPLNYR
jgi:uncharacterized protein (DUF2141 family)